MPLGTKEYSNAPHLHFSHSGKTDFLGERLFVFIGVKNRGLPLREASLLLPGAFAFDFGFWFWLG